MEFKGFFPETIDFLWGIRFNNNREWFMEHKKDYTNTLYEPMKALGAELFANLQDVPGLGYRVSRIYKDVRFSTGDPYKDHLWISFRRETEHWGQTPTLYFELNPEEYDFGFVYWQPRAAVMQAFRRDLAERPEILRMICQAEAESGCTLSGPEYKRKANQAPSAELERFYNLKGLWASISSGPNELLFSHDLVDEVTRTLKALLPVNEYFFQLTNQMID